jgi:hypothetical protein
VGSASRNFWRIFIHLCRTVIMCPSNQLGSFRTYPAIDTAVSF